MSKAAISCSDGSGLLQLRSAPAAKCSALMALPEYPTITAALPALRRARIAAVPEMLPGMFSSSTIRSATRCCCPQAAVESRGRIVQSSGWPVASGDRKPMVASAAFAVAASLNCQEARPTLVESLRRIRRLSLLRGRREHGRE